MALEQKLRLKLAQRLVMTPSLQQAIKLLQLSRLELEETLAQEILENPVLDVEEGEEAAAAAADQTEDRTSTSAGDDALPSEEEAYDDIDVEAFFADYLADHRPEGPSMAAADPGDSVPLENILSVSGGLADHLLWQLHLLDCSPRVVAIAEYIIGNLDEDGFLQASDDEILAVTGAAATELAEALDTVRSLDPPGVGARTLQECLTMQIDQLLAAAEDADDPAVLDRTRLVVTEHWNELLHQKWEQLAASCGCEVQDLKDVVE
ncbi:MAG: hypothetical protein PVG53_13595, partial [Holophagae bacterium]